jgi:hypothetical protein
MSDHIIKLSSESSSISCDSEILANIARRNSKPLFPVDSNLIQGTLSITNPHFSEPHSIWLYSPQKSESGESVTQSVSGFFSTLNPEPSVYKLFQPTLLTSNLLVIDSYQKWPKVLQILARVTVEVSLEMTIPLHLLSHSLDSESNPTYFSTGCSNPCLSTPGSNQGSYDYVDMESSQRIPQP